MSVHVIDDEIGRSQLIRESIDLYTVYVHLKLVEGCSSLNEWEIGGDE